MNRVLSVALNEDLTVFASFLWKNDIPNRIVELEDCQELWVSEVVDAGLILEWFNFWKSGQDLSLIKTESKQYQRSDAVQTLKQAPLASSLIVLSLFVSLITGFGSNTDLLTLFTFSDFRVLGDNLYVKGFLSNFVNLELWRFFTPIFVHFSELHIAFNLLWVWIIGTRMEIMQGTRVLLGLVLFSGLLSNFGQYIVSGPMFGGMSGVVFALLAYSWLWDKRHPSKRFGLPPALMGFMLVWLMLGYTGILEGLGFGAIANTAHLVGMLAGLAFVPIGSYLSKR